MFRRIAGHGQFYAGLAGNISAAPLFLGADAGGYAAAAKMEDIMQVNEVMTPHSVTLTPEQTLKDAAEIMRRIETGFVPVGMDDRLVGTITDRDIVIRGIAQGKSAETAVSEVMSNTSPLAVNRPWKSSPYQDARPSAR